MAKHTSTRKDLREYTKRVRHTVCDLHTWDPSNPNWELFNSIPNNDLKELAGLYAASVGPTNKKFLENTSRSKSITSKQKFRLLSILSKFK